jgi:hypothetical protein
MVKGTSFLAVSISVSAIADGLVKPLTLRVTRGEPATSKPCSGLCSAILFQRLLGQNNVVNPDGPLAIDHDVECDLVGFLALLEHEWGLDRLPV